MELFIDLMLKTLFLRLSNACKLLSKNFKKYLSKFEKLVNVQ